MGKLQSADSAQKYWTSEDRLGRTGGRGRKASEAVSGNVAGDRGTRWTSEDREGRFARWGGAGVGGGTGASVEKGGGDGRTGVQPARDIVSACASAGLGCGDWQTGCGRGQARGG